MIAFSSVYEYIPRSRLGIALFETPNVLFDSRFSSISRTEKTESVLTILSEALNLPKHIVDMICDTNVFADLAELRQSGFLAEVHTVSFIAP